MKRIICITIALLHSAIYSADLENITDECIKKITGKNVAQIADDIDNNGDPNPICLRYIMTPDYMSHSAALTASKEAEQTFPYAPLIQTGIMSQEKARTMAYEFAYDDAYHIYHSRPCINELIQRLSNMELPQTPSGMIAADTPDSTPIPLMFLAVYGGSPDIIQHIIDRGITINANYGNASTPIDAAGHYMLDRIQKASQTEFATKYTLLETLFKNGGHIQHFTPNVVDNQQNDHAPQQIYVNDRYHAIKDLVDRYQK